MVVKKKTITISAAAKTFKALIKTKKYTVTLKTIISSSANGKAYHKSGKAEALKVNWKTYTGKTNSKGQVTFKFTKLTKKGTYTAKISIAASSVHSAANKSVKLTIK